MPDSTQPSPANVVVHGEALLDSLGYKQELKRGLSVIGNLALVLSDITPTASLLVIGTVVIAAAWDGIDLGLPHRLLPGDECRPLHG